MERMWIKFSSFIDGLLFRKHLAENLKTASQVEKHVCYYLSQKGYTYETSVGPDPSDCAPRAVVYVRVKTKDVDELFRLWDTLCDVGYRGLPDEKAENVYIDCSQLDVPWRLSPSLPGKTEESLRLREKVLTLVHQDKSIPTQLRLRKGAVKELDDGVFAKRRLDSVLEIYVSED
jgi:hypothetical protein